METDRTPCCHGDTARDTDKETENYGDMCQGLGPKNTMKFRKSTVSRYMHTLYAITVDSRIKKSKIEIMETDRMSMFKEVARLVPPEKSIRRLKFRKPTVSRPWS